MAIKNCGNSPFFMVFFSWMLLRPGVVLRMDISNLTLKLIFILIPGAIAGLIFEKLTVHKPWNNFKFIAQSILFGLLAYLNTGWFIKLMNAVFNVEWSTLTLWANLAGKEIPFSEIGKATIAGILIGFIASAIDHHKIVNRFAAWMGISIKYDDINLYSHFLSSPILKQIHFKDFISGYIYRGTVESYWETDEIKEIVLRNVTVYENNSDDKRVLVELYKLDAVYLSRPKDEVLIEIFNNT